MAEQRTSPLVIIAIVAGVVILGYYLITNFSVEGATEGFLSGIFSAVGGAFTGAVSWVVDGIGSVISGVPRFIGGLFG